MIGTSFAAVTAGLAAFFTPSGASVAQAAHVMAYTAAGVATFVYLVGLISSFFLPEPGLHDAEDEHDAPPTPAASGQVMAHGSQP